jgi:chromosome segregation ATPase
MKITEIVVSAGRTFNHPYENFSNLRPQVTLKATLDEGDDPHAAAKELQGKAEKLVEDHKQNMLQTLRELHHLSMAKQEMYDVERKLADLNARLKDLREENQQLELPRGSEFMGGQP